MYMYALTEFYSAILRIIPSLIVYNMLSISFEPNHVVSVLDGDDVCRPLPTFLKEKRASSCTLRGLRVELVRLSLGRVTAISNSDTLPGSLVLKLFPLLQADELARYSERPRSLKIIFRNDRR